MEKFNLWSNLFRDISIRNKFYMSFFWIFVFTTISFVCFYYGVGGISKDSRNEYLAGRAKLLSQKLFAVSGIATDENSNVSKQAKTLLAETLSSLDQLYSVLENGGEIPMIDNSTQWVDPVDNLKIQAKLLEIRTVFAEHKTLFDLIIIEPTFLSVENQGHNENIAAPGDDQIPASLNFHQVLNPKVKVAQKRLKELAIENTLFNKNQQLEGLYSAFTKTNKERLIILLTILGLGSYLVIIFNFSLIQYYVVTPINKISKAAQQIALGNININISHQIKDGLGMIVNSINTLTGNLRKAAEFTVKIGQGDFDAKYDVVVAEGIDEKDNLALALMNMRDRLKEVAEDDKKRNWATEGYAKFGEILRDNSIDLKALSDHIISSLVKYLGANQGSLFIVNDLNPSDTYLELIACYAWNRKKYLQKKISLGEGLAGQVWQEGESIYMTDVPENYVMITSGLGESVPRSILIVPLKINETIFGVIEVAAFHTFEKNTIEFVEKLGESIASTISGVKINARTKKLLEESQQQSEELKAQEEEVRQNMEEMTATQEELQRKEMESQKLLAQSKLQEEKLRKNMEEMAVVQAEILQYKEESEAQRKTIHSMAIFSKTDINGNIIYVNDNFLKASQYSQEEIMGNNHRILKSGHQSAAFYKDLWNTISNGKIWRNDIKNQAKDGSFYWVDTVISPILDKNGKPKEYVSEGFLITDKKKKEELLIRELEELKRGK